MGVLISSRHLASSLFILDEVCFFFVNRMSSLFVLFFFFEGFVGRVYKRLSAALFTFLNACLMHMIDSRFDCLSMHIVATCPCSFHLFCSLFLSVRLPILGFEGHELRISSWVLPLFGSCPILD